MNEKKNTSRRAFVKRLLSALLLSICLIGSFAFLPKVAGLGEPQSSNNGFSGAREMFQSQTSANVMWIDSPAVSLDVGDRFNVTVWVNLCQSSFVWQCLIWFDTACLYATRSGPTGWPTSDFFKGHVTVPVGPRINNSIGAVWACETLIGSDSVLAACGSLFWVEFQVVSFWNTTKLRLDPVDSFVLDPYLNEIQLTMCDVTLLCPSPDFSMSASPALLTMQQGRLTTSTITVRSMNGFDQSVQLSVSGASSGVAAALSSSQVTPPVGGSVTSTLTVVLDSTATLGDYTLTVIGTTGTSIHVASISLEIIVPMVFKSPFALSDSSWHESHLAGQASSETTIDASAGTGEIVARALAVLLGDGKALAKLAYEGSWESDWSGESRVKATFNISGLITWASLSFLSMAPTAGVIHGVIFNASLIVRDYSSSNEISRKDLNIYDSESEWKILPVPDGDALSFRDAQCVIQSILNLEKGHRYTWSLELQIYAYAAVADAGESVAGGNMKISLSEVRIDNLAMTPEPLPLIFHEKFMFITIGPPADLLLVDAEGRRVGFDFVAQKEVNEIPEAYYSGHGISPQLIETAVPVTGDCHVFVSGTNTGFYHLSVVIGNLTEEDATDLKPFAIQFLGIPISAGAIHEYSFDSAVLSQGGKGIMVRVDSDGDGVFEHIFTSDKVLTESEYRTALCDINGDQKVDMNDIALAARAFGETSASPNWNPMADENEDGRIDLKDIGFVARHFGEHYS